MPIKPKRTRKPRTSSTKKPPRKPKKTQALSPVLKVPLGGLYTQMAEEARRQWKGFTVYALEAILRGCKVEGSGPIGIECRVGDPLRFGSCMLVLRGALANAARSAAAKADELPIRFIQSLLAKAVDAPYQRSVFDSINRERAGKVRATVPFFFPHLSGTVPGGHMTDLFLTLSLRGKESVPLARICSAQVGDGPKVKISSTDMADILELVSLMSEEGPIMTPVPGSEGEELSVRVPLVYPLHAYLPKECFAYTQQGPQVVIPGQIGALSMTVGGAEALASMMGVSTAEILAWANEGVPDGPAKILMVRLGEDFGLNLSRIPVMKRVDSLPQEAE